MNLMQFHHGGVCHAKTGTRKRAHPPGVAGTYVVTLGWDIEQQLKAGLLGFAIQRVDHTENETHFMRGMKSFPNTTPQLPPGGTASSHDQPFQSFQWADYAAKPDH